jgi:hypothetical protein
MDAYRIFVENLEKSLRRPRRRRENNIKADLKEVSCVYALDSYGLSGSYGQSNDHSEFLKRR